MPTQRTEDITIGEEEIVFYYTIGKAITEWGLVENVLRAVVLACFENKNDDDLTHRALSVGFFSISTFRAKLNFADGVVLRRFGSHSKEWEVLEKRADQTSIKRNKLAHWSVQTFPQNGPGRRLMLTPWVFQKPKPSLKRPTAPKDSLSLRDIHKMRADFISLAIALQNFQDRLRGNPESHPKSHEQPDRPPPIGKLRALILKELVQHIKAT